LPILFFDTETTGKLDRKKPPTDEGQPDLVQLAAILTDDDLNEISSLNCIVYPQKWRVPDEVAKIHGISHEKAEAYGLSLPTALAVFDEMAEIADRFVAHNIEFDNAIMARAYARAKRMSNPFEGKEMRCSMKAAIKILKLPKHNATPNDPYKYPRLEECVRYFFDEKLEGAHDALVDVRATIRVYRAECEFYGMAP
jgi:DNA polymerase-3 subunit epsilon